MNWAALDSEGKDKPLTENLGTIWSELSGFETSISIADTWLSLPIESWLVQMDHTTNEQMIEK